MCLFVVDDTLQKFELESWGRPIEKIIIDMSTIIYSVLICSLDESCKSSKLSGQLKTIVLFSRCW